MRIIAGFLLLPVKRGLVLSAFLSEHFTSIRRISMMIFDDEYFHSAFDVMYSFSCMSWWNILINEYLVLNCCTILSSIPLHYVKRMIIAWQISINLKQEGLWQSDSLFNYILDTNLLDIKMLISKLQIIFLITKQVKQRVKPKTEKKGFRLGEWVLTMTNLYS